MTDIEREAIGPHIVDGEFQSDKYPTCPRGKVPLSVKDPTAQDLLWEYAQRRRPVDAEFASDLEWALKQRGYIPAQAFLAKLDQAAPSSQTGKDLSPNILNKYRAVIDDAQKNFDSLSEGHRAVFRSEITASIRRRTVSGTEEARSARYSAISHHFHDRKFISSADTRWLISEVNVLNEDFQREFSALRAKLSTIEAETVERCAKVAKTLGDEAADDDAHICASTAYLLSAAIRSIYRENK